MGQGMAMDYTYFSPVTTPGMGVHTDFGMSMSIGAGQGLTSSNYALDGSYGANDIVNGGGADHGANHSDGGGGKHPQKDKDRLQTMRMLKAVVLKGCTSLKPKWCKALLKVGR